MYWIVLIIIALLLAWGLTAVFKQKEIPGGYWNILIATLIGSYLGDLILGNWAWTPGSFNVIAGIIGGIIIGWLDIFIFSRKETIEE